MTPAMIGDTFHDRYEIVEELGRGGMGVVYRAWDKSLGRHVALKTLLAASSKEEVQEARFRREVQLLARLDHPGIVPVFDFGRRLDRLFFVMPLLGGTTLRALREQGPIDPDLTLALGIQIALALSYCHDRGVVHRDLKPSNVMVERDGGTHRARLMDFGLAIGPTTDSQTGSGDFIGTLEYASPEQLGRDEIDGRSDVYSLGVILFECLSGKLPFSGPTRRLVTRILTAPPPSLRALGVGVEPELDELLSRSLAKMPADRPPTARVVAEQLIRLRANRGIRRTSAPRAMPPRALPFVGRGRDLELLRERLDRARSGATQLVVVGGGVGTGRSRLLFEVERMARELEVDVLRGRHSDIDSSFPHEGFYELLVDGLRTGRQPDLTPIAGPLAGLFPQLADILPSLEVESDPPGADPQAVFELLAQLCLRLAGGRPLVLLLENLHCADSSNDALQYLLRRLVTAPLLVVATYLESAVDRGHPTIRLCEAFDRHRSFLHIRLEPLSPTETGELVSALLGHGLIDQSILSRLHEATEGNPLFVIEMTRGLLESGALRLGFDGDWQLLEDASSARLPATIHQAVERRIEGLPGSLREILSAAALLGQTFDERDLEHLVPGIEDGLDELVQLEVLRESTGHRLEFTSRILRTSLYQALGRRRRRRLHRLHAEHLEAVFADPPDPILRQLLHHSAEGDDGPRTVRYARLVTTRAFATFSPDDALRASRLALEFLEAESTVPQWSEIGFFRRARSRAYGLKGDPDRALTEAERAIEAIRVTGDHAEIARGCLLAAEAAWRARRLDEADRWVHQGLPSARSSEDLETRSALLTVASRLANLLGERDRAAPFLEERRRLSRGPQRPRPSPRGRLVVGMAGRIRSILPGELKRVEEMEISACVFETLVGLDGRGRLEPQLAERWSTDDEGLTWVFDLDPSARFSDGTPITAHAVEVSLLRSLGSWPTPPPALGMLAEAEAGHDHRATRLSGLRVESDTRLVFSAREPTPLLPVFFTDLNCAISRLAEDGSAIGSGPFSIASIASTRVELTVSADPWHGPRPALAHLTFRAGIDPAQMSSALREGEIDLARDLPPGELDLLLHSSGGSTFFELIESTRKNVTFLLFHEATCPLDLRRALTEALDVPTLVWSTLGRTARPAQGLVPPGVLGYDPGRRSLGPRGPRLRIEELGRPLRVAIHPIVENRHGPLVKGILDTWRGVGIEIEENRFSVEAFLETATEPGSIDVVLARWHADYPDPDNFTHSLFHRKAGYHRRYFSSAVTDELLEQARAETVAEKRVALYHAFEDELRRQAILIPLFHEVDERCAAPDLTGLRLTPTPPFATYAEASRTEPTPAPASSAHLELVAPVPEWIDSLDPTAGNILEHCEIMANVFDTLTRTGDGGEVEPWLAQNFQAERGGRVFRFRLRPGVRFHDGRPLTARDVRASFERLLQRRGSDLHFLLLPVAGARSLRDGQATELAGLEILSDHELVVELNEPLPFFPALLTHPGTSILPEGTESIGRGASSSWRNGCVGSGPFRVVSSLPGEELELERNPYYWRPGRPHASRLTFRCFDSPSRILTAFRAGELSIAQALTPAGVEALRQDPGFAGTYVDAPRLSTYFLAFNTHSGVLADPERRLDLVACLELDRIREETLGRLATRAETLIPPGLLGREATGVGSPDRPADPSRLAGLALRVAVLPSLVGQYGVYWQRLALALREVGFDLELLSIDALRAVELARRGEIDLLAYRWVADYPDADAFVVGLLHSRDGIIGPLCGSEELDALGVEARRELDPALRQALYRRIEAVIARDRPLLPLFHEQTYRFARPDLGGLRLSLGVPEVHYENVHRRR